MADVTPTVVVGFVDSPTGRAAIEAAIAEAHVRRARLAVVHSMLGGSSESVEDVLAYRELLEDLDRRLTAEGLPHEIHTYARGNEPFEDICRAAEDLGAILIVIGYRRRSPAGKLLLGSDARDTLLNAPCPVLAVRAGAEPPG
jgi:nucleotide-binding universal stress UspA family protein